MKSKTSKIFKNYYKRIEFSTEKQARQTQNQ